eukprot:m.179468 g.179468  ORF g.179468 m.179468 type:complete len:150 (-) comp53424_c0_seq3:100-549(-)
MTSCWHEASRQRPTFSELIPLFRWSEQEQLLKAEESTTDSRSQPSVSSPFAYETPSSRASGEFFDPDQLPARTSFMYEIPADRRRSSQTEQLALIPTLALTNNIDGSPGNLQTFEASEPPTLERRTLQLNPLYSPHGHHLDTTLDESET